MMSIEKSVVPQLVPCWRFTYEELEGYLRGGHEHGIEFSRGIDGHPLTKAMCLNLEHYFALSCHGGQFVPRYKATVQTRQIDDDSIRVEIKPYEEWKIHSTITYKLLPQCTIQVDFEFYFDAGYRGFEALISNYFLEATEPYLHVGGHWLQPSLTDNEHRCWPRDEHAAQNITKIQSNQSVIIPNNDIHLPIDSQFYDYPIMVTPIRDTDWSIINFIDQSVCASLSANRKWKAHDFSLLGRDVAAGESACCRAWIVYRQLNVKDDRSLDEMISVYQELMVG